MPEASNVQESLAKAEPPNLLKGILPNTDSLRSIFDLNNSASTIKERVESINKGLEGLKLRSNPSFKLPDRVKPFENTNLNKFKIRESKIPDIRFKPFGSNIKPLDITKPLIDLKGSKINKLGIPRLKLNSARTTNDNNPSPSNVQEQFQDSLESKDSPSRLKPLLPLPTIKPLDLQNLLNLKDVELIPPKSNKAKLIRSNDKDNYDNKEATNIQVISKEKSVNTEILDAVPSPSENHQVLAEIDESIETTTVKLEKDIKKDDSCYAHLHDTDEGANEISEVQKDYSQAENIDTLSNKKENSQIANQNMEHINQEPYKGEMNIEEHNKEDREDDDHGPSASSPEINIQEIGAMDYENEDSDAKETDEEETSHDSMREGCLENIDNDNDAMTEASSNVVQIVPQEQSKNKIENESNEDEITQTPLKIIEDNSSNERTESIEIEEDDGINEATSGSQVNDISGEDESGEDNDSGNLNIEDLQQLSDSLLDQSNTNEEKDLADSKLACKTGADDFGLKSNENIEQDNTTPVTENSEDETDSFDLNPSASSLETKILETTEKSSGKSVPSSILENQNSDVFEIKKCSSDLDLPKSVSTQEIVETQNDQDTMHAEATKPLISIVPQFTSKSSDDSIPGSSVRQNVVVQPSSLFGGNGLDIFRRPIAPLPDLLNLNTNIPTLEEIQSSISNLFGTQERDADEDEFSTEIDSDNDCSNRNSVMSSDASTRSSKIKLPRKKLEDVDIDIFQLNPLSLNNPLKSQLPVLNLNSYKTKLALPKTLDLKPMKFESTLGNKGGLLGATFSVGPRKTGFSRKAKPKSNSGSLFNNKPIILGNPLGSLPSLDDLNLKMNSQPSLNINTRSHPLGDPLRASQAISDNLRAHTENTVKNLQQSLSSTLSEARVRNSDVLGTKLATPQDLLEKVTMAHDDMNDKLKAIHYDLNDRLTSLHESIVDQTRLPSLSIPIVKDSPLKYTLKPQSKLNARSDKLTSLVRSEPKVVSYKSSRINKPQNTPRLSSPQTREQKLKPFKMSTAASSLTPKSVEVPTLTTMPTKSPFTGLQRDPNLKLKENKSSLFAPKEQKKTRKYNRPNLMKKFKPFGETQVKVSFATTSRPTLTKPRSSFTTARPKVSATPLQSQKLTMPRSNPLRKRPASMHNFKSADSKGHASDIKPRITTPEKANIKPKPTLRKAGKEYNLREANNIIPKSETKTLPFKLEGKMHSLPTTTESAFLSKVKEAFKSRFTTSTPSTTTEIAKTNTQDDMARSASENNELVIVRDEPMKENVSYKCKMVCFRDT